MRAYALRTTKLVECEGGCDASTFDTSSTARGGGASFKKKKTIGEISCCASRMSKQKH